MKTSYGNGGGKVNWSERRMSLRIRRSKIWEAFMLYNLPMCTLQASQRMVESRESVTLQ